MQVELKSYNLNNLQVSVNFLEKWVLVEPYESDITMKRNIGDADYLFKADAKEIRRILKHSRHA